MGLQAVRHKGDDLSPIKTTEDLDRALMLVGLFDLRVERINQDLELAIKKAQDEALEKMAEIKSDHATWLAKIQAYLLAHRTELLGAKKSRQLNFGKVGFRKTPDKVQLPKKGTPEMEELVLRINAFAEEAIDPWGDITTHTDNYVLKTDLKELKPKHFRHLLLEVTPGKDEPFVEPNREKIVTLPDGNLEAAS